MTTKEILDKILKLITELSELYAELAKELPQLRFIRGREFSEVKKIPLAR